MSTVVTSKHLQGSSELTLIAQIKPGFVPIPDPTSYASRLRTTLEFLFQARQRAVELDGQVGNAGPLERLRSLHFVHWSIHDQDRKLLLSVDFDGPWEPYIRAIVDEAGPILDVIFSHCDGYAGNSCFDGYQKFAGWVRERQVNVDFFYAGAPDVTVDDLRYLQDFERKHASGKRREDFETVAAKLRVLDLPGPQADSKRIREILSSLYRVSRQFPGLGAAGGSDDAAVFGRVAALLTREMRLAVFGNGQGKAALSIPPDSNALEQVALDWAKNGLAQHDVKPSPAGHEELANPAAIQGNILSKYPDISHGCVLLARFESAASGLAFVRKWKDRIDTEVEPATRRAARDGFPLASETKFNLALTKNGLHVLGVSPEELALFPKEFQEGLEARAGMLGDIGKNHPRAWERPILNLKKPSQPAERLELACVDAVLLVQRKAPESEGDHTFSDANPLFSEIMALGEEPGIQILHVQPLRSYAEGHFGLRDGLSQPRPRGTTEAGVADRDQVALGELLLGYENERGERALAASDPDHTNQAPGPSALPLQLLHNSTFLVIRKMSQNVAAFNEAISDAAQNSGLAPEAFKTTLLGRKPSGASLLVEQDGCANDFDYEADKDGDKCPLFSHVRRANPRNPRMQNGRKLLPPRIVRRGMSYGSLYEHDHEDTSERGLLFMAYAGSLAEQYEVIQRWINGGNSSGVQSAHPDLLAGTFPEQRSDRLLSFLQEGQVKKLPLPQKPFTALRWGLYLFVPSTTALEFLVQRAYKPKAPPSPSLKDQEAIAQRVEELFQLEQEDLHRAALEWKRLLEDRDQHLQARALWQYIRGEGGALKTAYGLLVGSAEGVRRVLEEANTFSVRRYWTRMRRTFGEHYLGMDPEPQPLAPGVLAREPPDGGDFDAQADDYEGYAQEVPPYSYEQASKVPNQFAMKISRAEAYACALRQTLAWFAEQPRLEADITMLARQVIYGVAKELFGLPGAPIMTSVGETPKEEPSARCPLDFQRVSQFVFHPRPSLALAEEAERRGKVVKEQITKFIQSPEAADSRFCQYYRKEPSPSSPVAPALLADQGEASALTGLVNGFAVPTSASFVSVLLQWLDSQQLWRYQRWLYGKTTEDDAFRSQLLLRAVSEDDLSTGPLWQAIVSTLANAPVPDLLHRVATGTTELGGEPIAPGDRVVVSLASAALDRQEHGDPEAWALLFGGNRGLSDKPVHACPGAKMAIGVLFGMLVGVMMQKNLTRRDKVTLAFERPLGAGIASGKS